MSNNYKNASVGLRYYWFRRAEFTSQYYLNETTYPKEQILNESTILTEFLNISSATLDSYDNVIGSMNSFANYTLTGFDTLHWNMYNSLDYEVTALKGKNILGIYHYGTGTTLNNTKYRFDNNLYNHLCAPDTYILGRGTTSAKTILFKDAEDNFAVNVTIPSTNNQIAISFPPENLTHGATYTVQYIGTSDAFALPICFIPDTSTDVKTYDWAYAMNFTHGSGIDYSKMPIRYIECLNNSEVVYTITLPTATNLKEYITYLSSAKEDAMSAGLAYWNFLRSMGYYSIDDIPKSYYIPSISIIGFESDITENLSAEQLFALYVAYNKAMGEWFTSETYKTAINMTSTDIKLSDLKIACNITAYNKYGNETLINKKLAFLMPTTANLVLKRDKNNTLTQTVNTIYETGYENDTWLYLQLTDNDKVYVHDFYKEGEWQNITEQTISVYTLRQLSLQYDFTLTGEPTYAYTDISAWMPILIALMVMSAIMGVMTKRKKRS